MSKTRLETETFVAMVKRIQDQADYIKELEEANDYKDKVIKHLNEKYAVNPNLKEL